MKQEDNFFQLTSILLYFIVIQSVSFSTNSKILDL